MNNHSAKHTAPALAAGLATALATAAGVDTPSISLVECPKCTRRMRIVGDGSAVDINLCRLRADAPDAVTLELRIAEMRERARRLIALGRERPAGGRTAPLMGWSSWNTFAVDISERLICETAQTMAENGLRDAGYLYVNIDDGFFDGHDENGKLRIHPERFPNGLGCVADRIHSLGLRAGIYSDAGADTCGSGYSGDTGGRGSGLYGHDRDDCRFYFRDCGFDFIKVDYCGGGWLNLDEKKRYTEIAEAVREAGGGKVRLNICRWRFPGTWAASIADSWRTTEDIRANWRSVRGIISQNLYLSAFASPGHYNDMDMLEVGHRVGTTKTGFSMIGDTGLTWEEEKTHFGMWCMLSSPLLIGCDVRTIPRETKDLVTNPYLVSMDQNRGLGAQGYVVSRFGDAYVLAKDAFVLHGKSRYVALYNSGDGEASVTLDARALDLGGRLQVFDLVEKADVGEFSGSVTLGLPPHGSRFFLVDADERLERVRYSAGTAYLSAYQQLSDPEKSGTPFHAEASDASEGIIVRNVGGCEENDLVWKDVRILRAGDRTLRFRVASDTPRTFFVQIDGGDKTALASPGGGFATVETKAFLSEGSHEIRVSNAEDACPDFDCMTL